MFSQHATRSWLEPGSNDVRPASSIDHNRGIHLADVVGNMGNYLTTPGGKTKIIDYLPASKSKLESTLGGSRPWMRKAQKEMGMKMRSAVNTAEREQVKQVKAVLGQQGLRVPGGKLVPDFGSRGQPRPIARKPGYGAKLQATQMRELTGSGTAASDYGVLGLRRADARRALQGLGGGSRQSAKLRK